MFNYVITPNSQFDLFILIFGGLAVFLFGLNLTKENLKKLANKKLEYFIFNCTNTPLKAFAIGIITTTLIQSSSGVTAIVVSFIAAGYLSFSQGLGIMIGANIGTCTTAFLFGLKVENNALLIIFLAFLLSSFCTNNKKLLFQALLGIGTIFLGLQLMGFGFETIGKDPTFITIMKFYANKNFPALLLGIILTFIIQSSSAIIGLLEQIYAANLISLQPAIMLLLGANIGTTLTGLIATIATNTEAKKAVIANILFNIFGTILFIILLNPYAYLLNLIKQKNIITTPELMIASAHLIFNVITVVVAYFTFDYLIKLTNTIFSLNLKNKKVISFKR
jgi:phosphate:Na+ symporter